MYYGGKNIKKMLKRAEELCI